MRDYKNCFVSFSTGTIAVAGSNESFTLLSGRFAELTEELTYDPDKDRTRHWIVIGLDRDNCGPTTRMFFKANKWEEMFWLFVLARNDIVLKPGDGISFTVRGGSLRVCVNGRDFTKTIHRDYADYAKANKKKDFGDVLTRVRGYALKRHDRREAHFAYELFRLVTRRLMPSSIEELRTTASFMLAGETDPDISFEQLYRQLEKNAADNGKKFDRSFSDFFFPNPVSVEKHPEC